MKRCQVAQGQTSNFCVFLVCSSTNSRLATAIFDNCPKFLAVEQCTQTWQSLDLLITLIIMRKKDWKKINHFLGDGFFCMFRGFFLIVMDFVTCKEVNFWFQSLDVFVIFILVFLQFWDLAFSIVNILFIKS